MKKGKRSRKKQLRNCIAMIVTGIVLVLWGTYGMMRYNDMNDSIITEDYTSERASVVASDRQNEALEVLLPGNRIVTIHNIKGNYEKGEQVLVATDGQVATITTSHLMLKQMLSYIMILSGIICLLNIPYVPMQHKEYSFWSSERTV